MVKATDGAGEREYELALAAGDQVRLFRRTNAKFMETGTVGNIGRNKLVSAFGAYMSGSRHREQSFIVTSEGAERAEIIARRPLGDRREIGRSDVLNNIVRNFAQAPEKQAALVLMERAAGLRRGAVQAVQRVHQAAKARGSGLERRSVLRERMLSRRIAQAFEKQLPGLAAQLRRHGEVLGRVALIGVDLTEMLASLSRRQAASR